MCYDISLLNLEEAISTIGMRRIVIHYLKPYYITIVTSIQGWYQHSFSKKFENFSSSQELLGKQLVGEFVEGKGNSLIVKKGKFKQKTYRTLNYLVV